MINLNDVLLYLDCPKKFALSKAGIVKDASDNDKLKTKVKDAILKCLQSNLTVVQFAEEVGTITHGKTNVKVDGLYKLIQENKDKLLDKDYRLNVSLKTPTNGYEQSLYYNLYQVLECDNKELKFNVVVLNVNPKLEQVILSPRTQEQIKEAKLIVQSVDRIINTVEKEQLVYIKRPNNINCSSCGYNKE